MSIMDASTPAERVGKATYALLFAKGLDMFDYLDAMPLWSRVTAVKCVAKYGDSGMPDEMAQAMITSPMLVKEIIAGNPALTALYGRIAARARERVDTLGLQETVDLLTDTYNLGSII
jgi:hypothetical protein